MNAYSLAFAFLPSLMILASCEDATSDAAPTKRTRPLVFTTIHPIQYFVLNLAGEHVDCEVALPQGGDPRHWVPDRATLTRLAAADLVIFHGATLDDWRSLVGLPRSRQSVVCTGFDEHFLKIEGAITHTHGGKSHTHDGIDPILWLDLQLAIREADVVARALKRLLPDHGAAIDHNLEALHVEIRQELTAQTSLEIPEKILCAADHLYDYWARRQQREIPKLDLSASGGIDEARKLLAKHPAKLVLCPKEPTPAERRALSELDLTPVVFDPCFTARDGEDYLTAMRANRKRLQAALDALGG